VITLASQSASRKAMLTAAGVGFVAKPAHIDERALEHSLGDATPHAIAKALAEAKALAVSRVEQGLVLGSDSLVVIGGRRFDKPATREDAAAHLRFFSAKTMHLVSAAALTRNDEVVWSATDEARLQVRDLSDGFIETYLDAEWPAVAGCVGVFRIEGLGVQLFDSIAGDQFTILGMPLLPVLAALRAEEELTA
jgi:septum formation protein